MPTNNNSLACETFTPTKKGTLDISTLANNPLYAKQWYLNNTGQNGATAGLDINVESAWQQGYTGKGITVAVFDYMLDIRHEDYKNNLAKACPIGSAGAYSAKKTHGTNVAGIIAAEHNNKGIVGVAPHANIYGFGFATPEGHHRDIWHYYSQESEDIAVYNFSFGLNNVGSYNEEDLPILGILDKGIKNGWGGLGSSYVTSSGNSSFYPLTGEIMAAHHGVIGVSGVNKNGNVVPFGVKKGLQHWVSAFTNDIVTTDNMAPDGADPNSNYRKDFAGTSSATPMVAGVVALIRQANPDLTYRDVKLILAETASKDGINSTYTWKDTGQKKSLSGNYQYNNFLGFGIVDAGEAVKLAKTWRPLTQPIIVEEYQSETRSLQPDTTTLEVDIAVNSSTIQFTEFIQFTMDFTFRTPITKKKLGYLQGANTNIDVTDPKDRTHTLLDSLYSSGFNLWGWDLKNDKFKFVTGYNLYLGKHSPAANGGQWKVILERPENEVIEGKKVYYGALGKYISKVKISMKVYGH